MKEQASPMSGTGQSAQLEVAPFRIAPKFYERVWGFKDLHPWYDFVPEGEPIGEAWLTGEECRIETGPHAGQTLGSLFEVAPEALLGPVAPSPASPLLIKVIFPREKLSVQVHPDDAMARKYGSPNGKTECWYVLAADAGAKVAVGLKPGVTLNKIRAGIYSRKLEESLKVLDLAAGETVLVDAGTVHAIWPGSILLETQQNSDLTYRMYDYGRGRELQIEKAIEATRLTTRSGKVPQKKLSGRILLVDAEYFRMERIPVTGSRDGASLRSKGEPARGLAYLFAANGSARIAGPEFEPVDLPARGMVAIPATSPEFAVENLGGLDLIRIAPNWPKRAK